MAQSTKIAKNIEWGAISFTLPGEKECGDLHLVREFPGGVLIAVIDGLGHGSEAAYASQRAVSVLSKNPEESLISLVKRCHEELLQTRGAVLSIARTIFAEQTLSWVSVGNVDGILCRADTEAQPSVEHVFHRGGVVGYQLPQIRVSVLPIAHEDLLIMATDGIRTEFHETVKMKDPPQKIAEEIGAKYRKESDDALILVARYLREQ